MVFMGVSSLALAVAFQAMRGMYLHAERLLAKVGGSNCKPRGIPTLATGAQRKWKGRSAAEVCTSEARKIGEWLAGARGDLPLAAFAVTFVLAGGALRGGMTSPLRWGTQDTSMIGGRSEGGALLRAIIQQVKNAMNPEE
jgi:hypothetical protein